MDEHRERLRKAIDDMEKTETCLDIYDRGIAARLAALRKAGEELAKRAQAYVVNARVELSVAMQHLDDARVAWYEAAKEQP